MSIVAGHASGDVRIYSRNALAVTFGAAQLATFAAGVTAAGFTSSTSVALTGTTNNLGTITSGVWNAGAVTASGLITANGGAIRSSSRTYTAQHEQERASGKWKYGALNTYLENGTSLDTALKMAHLADVPQSVVLERLAQFRLGAFSVNSPAKDNATTLAEMLDSGTEV